LIVTALIAYLPGHLLAAYDQVLIFAFYARQNTLLPVMVGVIASLAYVACALAFVDRFEMAGLVVANSVQLGLHTLLMIWLARQQFGGQPFEQLIPLLSRILVAATIMSVAGWIAYRSLNAMLPDWQGMTGQLREVLIVAVPLTVCALVYLLLLRRLRVRELDDLVDVATSRLANLRAGR
jgi:putative peptidoglycan lipid II flippase